MKASLESLVQQ